MCFKLCYFSKQSLTRLQIEDLRPQLRFCVGVDDPLHAASQSTYDHVNREPTTLYTCLDAFAKQCTMSKLVDDSMLE